MGALVLAAVLHFLGRPCGRVCGESPGLDPTYTAFAAHQSPGALVPNGPWRRMWRSGPGLVAIQLSSRASSALPW